MKTANNNRFPLYIPTKGRYDYMHTAIALTAMNVKHRLIVEPQEVDLYMKSVRDKGLISEIVPLDMSFKEKYDTCDDLGLTRSVGPGAARNFAWQHSIDLGYSHHWVMDDNINWFYRFNHNLKTPCRSSAYFRVMEDFTLRYDNVAMSGPNYFMFVKRKDKLPPFVINTRIYSCNFIKNDLPFRWRGRYNEDTILSLDILKAGHCTIQFNTYLQEKLPTQTIKGGNTDEFYHAEGELKAGDRYADGGTDAKSQMLVDQHPDVAKVVHKFGRTHHQVSFKDFKQELHYRDNYVVPTGNNEYGMVLKEVDHYRFGY